MIISIKQFFAPPVFAGDEKKTYRVKLLNVMINLAVFFLVIIVTGNLLDSSTPPRNFVIDFIFIGMFLFLRRLLLAGRVEWVGYFIVTSAFILMTVSVASEGTILAPATALFSLLVIISGFIFNLWGIISATIISSLVVAGLILARHAGILPPPDYTESTFQWFAFTSTFGLIGGLSYFYNQLTDQALERSRIEIRERERAEADLRKLTRAVEQSPASIVITGLDGSIEYVNPRFTQVTGYSFEETLGKNPRILKTGLTQSEKYLQLWGNLTAGKEWKGEFVNRKKNGSLYYELANISPITDLNGVTTHYLAVKEDITDRKRAEEKLRQQNEFFSILHQITLDLLDRRDMAELLQAIVDRAVALLDAPFGELMLEKDGELIVQTFTSNQPSLKGDRVGRSEARLSWEAFDTQMPVVLEDYSTFENRREIYAGEGLHAVADFPVLTGAKCIGILAVGRSKPGYFFSETQIKNGILFAQLVALVLDSAQLFSAAQHEIVERKQAEESLQHANERLQVNLIEIEQLQMELREQALHDPLTGLYNRRFLNATTEREIARAKRENGQVSVIISDIDHFKQINDTYGHQTGDQFLVEMAGVMKTCARSSDIVCRYGGEEFLLVLPGSTMDSARKRAEEIRQKCAEVIIQHEGKDLAVTLSFGVATYPDHGQEAEEIIIKADKALYRSKHNGRNQVTIWGE